MPKLRRVLKRFTVFVVVMPLLILGGVLGGIGAWVYLLYRDLPDVSRIQRYRPERSSQLLDTQGRVLAYLFDQEHRLWVPLSRISENLQMAVIVAEDDTFFQHRGVNYRETWNAFKVDLEKGQYVRGGSTITQQLAKNVFLSKEKTLERKIKEYFIARELEKTLTKKKILELYLNEVEWGDGIYGAEAVSRTYFGKPASELEVHEAALLAAMLPNPKYLNPYTRFQRVKKRQERILRLMYANKLLTREELQDALSAQIFLREDSGFSPRLISKNTLTESTLESCPLQYLESYLVDRYGKQRLYRGGMLIKTTLDDDLLSAFRMGVRESEEYLEGQGIVQPVSASDPWLLVMKVESIPRAWICIDGEQKASLLLDQLQSSRPPDALYDYSLENVKAFHWQEVIRSS